MFLYLLQLDGKRLSVKQQCTARYPAEGLSLIHI